MNQMNQGTLCGSDIGEVVDNENNNQADSSETLSLRIALGTRPQSSNRSTDTLSRRNTQTPKTNVCLCWFKLILFLIVFSVCSFLILNRFHYHQDRIQTLEDALRMLLDTHTKSDERQDTHNDDFHQRIENNAGETAGHRTQLRNINKDVQEYKKAQRVLEEQIKRQNDEQLRLVESNFNQTLIALKELTLEIDERSFETNKVVRAINSVLVKEGNDLELTDQFNQMNAKLEAQREDLERMIQLDRWQYEVLYKKIPEGVYITQKEVSNLPNNMMSIMAVSSPDSYFISRLFTGSNIVEDGKVTYGLEDRSEHFDDIIYLETQQRYFVHRMNYGIQKRDKSTGVFEDWVNFDFGNGHFSKRLFINKDEDFFAMVSMKTIMFLPATFEAPQPATWDINPESYRIADIVIFAGTRVAVLTQTPQKLIFLNFNKDSVVVIEDSEIDLPEGPVGRSISICEKERYLTIQVSEPDSSLPNLMIYKLEGLTATLKASIKLPDTGLLYDTAVVGYWGDTNLIISVLSRGTEQNSWLYTYRFNTTNDHLEELEYLKEQVEIDQCHRINKLDNIFYLIGRTNSIFKLKYYD